MRVHWPDHKRTNRICSPKMIVILEDNEDRQTIMQDCLSTLEQSLPIHVFKSSFETIDWLKAHLQETKLIALDHDLEMIETEDPRKLIDPGTGREVADYLATIPPVCPVIVHTTNTPAGVGMELKLKAAGWKTKRMVPYGDMEWIPEMWFPTARKLLSNECTM